MTDQQLDLLLSLILRNLENCKDMSDLHKEIEFLESLKKEYLVTTD